jgi:hypothetical protein
MADYSSMLQQPQPQAPFGVGGIAPNQATPAPGQNPYTAAPSPYSQFGANGGAQGSAIPLGQPSPNGTTVNQLSAPSSTDDSAKKQLLAKALMGAAQSGVGQSSLLQAQPTNLSGIIPGSYVQG